MTYIVSSGALNSTHSLTPTRTLSLDRTGDFRRKVSGRAYLKSNSLSLFLCRHGIHNSVTVTTEVRTNGATTLSRMNFSEYVGHVTIFS